MQRSIKLCLFFYLSVFTFTNSFCQKKDYKTFFTKGNDYLLEENNQMALVEFLKAYAIDSSNANINFKVGYCYLFHPTQKHLAENFLQRAIKSVAMNYNEDSPLFKDAPPYAYFYYGQALHTDYKFDEAIKMYDAYEKLLDPKQYKDDIEIVEHFKQMVVNARKRIASPAKVKITNLGDSVNSIYPEYSPLLSADERMLIFTYRGIKSTGAELGLKTSDGRFFEDIFVSYKKDDDTWTTPVSLSANVNTMGHEASVGLTPDGQTLLIYKDDRQNGGDLYHSIWTGSDWSIPEKFGPEINSKYWEPSACFSPDGTTLYFVSDRPEGYGGRDIYRCKKLPNGKWSLPMNMGPKINTAFEEDAPFMHPNGTDLYFSSQGHGSMGGFDIMFSKMDENGNFSDPFPLDYPINTTDDDVFFTTSPDSRRGYYASSHEDRAGYGEKDIYMINLGERKEKEELVLLKGQIISSQGFPLPAGIEVFITDKNSGALVGLYRPQAKTGTFVSILNPGSEYVVSYQMNGKEFHVEDLVVKNESAYQEIQREVLLDPVKIGIAGISTPILLDVLVLNTSDQNKPVANASITISEKDSSGIKITTDINGKADNIKLVSGKTYSVAVAMGNNHSEIILSTNGLKEQKINKTLYLSDEVATVTNSSFRNYFVYNKNKVDQNNEYKQFLADVEKKLKETGKAEISIHSSASKVPTSQYGGSNKKLADLRAESVKAGLIEFAKSKGFNEKNITFDLSSSLGGPEYKGDFLINKKEYEKFQYVEAKLK